MVLSRRPGTSIVINNEIVVTIIEVKGDKVRIGVAAPSNIPVHRYEVQQEIERERRTPPPYQRSDTL